MVPGAGLGWFLALYTLSFPLLLAVTLYGLVRQAARFRRLKLRFRGIIDVEAEIDRLLSAAKSELLTLRAGRDLELAEIATLRASYQEKRKIYDDLAHRVAVFDETLAFAEMGLYTPHFDFDDSDTYKANITQVRDKQKQMVTDKQAAQVTTTWTVDGSVSKGKTMSGRNVRLTLRAFNGECDGAIANARWNNIVAMEKRVENAREQIDKLNESNAVTLNPAYVELKIQELRLTHEYREKLKAEKDERAEAARSAREEQKLQRDLELAESEEQRYARMLDKAQQEAASVSGAQLSAFAEQIKMLERDLAEAHAKVARAQALAEKTRSGYVYIISNVGSFGPDIVKIGLTRRLDPTDRVRELGDASVPFFFDTHAIIYSDNAPALEHALHQEFEPQRVNTSNFRKEFFRVSIDEVESAVRKLAPEANFFSDIEAQEYRESIARRQASFSGSIEVETVILEAI